MGSQDQDRQRSVPPTAAEEHATKQREHRAETVAKLKKQQIRDKRNRSISIIAASVVGVAIVALAIAFIVSNARPERDPADIDIAGVETWDDLTANHVDPRPVNYETQYAMNPPAGGDHWGAWLNCGVYTETQQNENASHSMEHGAVWATYNAEELGKADVDSLRSQLPDGHVIVSPYDDLQAPVVLSAWGAQVQLDGVDDPRLDDFVEKYWQSADAPEPGASCDGALDGPGKIG